MNTPKIEWKEPPAAKLGPHNKYDPIVAELKKYPGRWAQVGGPFRTNSGRQRYLKQRYPGLEAISRTEQDGVYIYARWPEDVGDGQR